MGNCPKHNEEIIDRAVNALRTLAPDAKFNGLGLAEIAPQAERSMAPRRRIEEVNTIKTDQIALRINEDKVTLKMIEKIVLGILGDDNYGKDSALYEAFGFVRKSKRKTGLTHKKKSEVKEMP
jgi:hypothetical protein